MVDRMTLHSEKQGITVKHLKEILSHWPDYDSYGDENEVWIVTKDGYSNVLTEVCPLNHRKTEDGYEYADVSLSATCNLGG